MRSFQHISAGLVYEDNSPREAADHMGREGIGRLPVVSRAAPRRVTGMLTRNDLLAAHGRRLEELQRAEQTIRRARREAAVSARGAA